MKRPVNPAVNADPLLCSEFREGRNFRCWRPHGSGDWLLIFTREGAGKVRVAGEELKLVAGDALLYAPGAAQSYMTDAETGRWHLRWVHFQPRPHWRAWLMWPQLTPLVGRLSLAGPSAVAVNAAFERMMTATRLSGTGQEDLAMNALEEILIWTSRLAEGESFSGVDIRVQRAAHYLARHPNAPFELEKLAAHCSLSVSRLSHLFRAELGTSPQQFSEKLRMDFARQLLTQTNLSVAEVAREVGYEDALYFSRRFQKTFLKAPSLVRLTKSG